jgi:hypothetical protein
MNHTIRNIIFILLAVLVLSLLWVYTHRSVSKTEPNQQQIVSSPITFTKSGYTLSIHKDGSVIQTISLDQDAMQDFASVPEDVDMFITNLDVNFDGYTDIGVFTSTGYGGVNDYYDFYVYNPQAKKFLKDDVLKDISNPQVDTAKKQVVSNYRSGPVWYTDTFQFKDNAYIKSTVESE